MIIKLLPEVLDYFNELSSTLYEKNYFGFEENALEYVDDLLNEIEATLHVRQKRNAPPYFNKYGRDMYYSSFLKNKNTEWYVFFNVYQKQGETIYLVRFISNNHVSAQHF